MSPMDLVFSDIHLALHVIRGSTDPAWLQEVARVSLRRTVCQAAQRRLSVLANGMS